MTAPLAASSSSTPTELSATSDLAAVGTAATRVLRPERALPGDAVRPTRAEVNLANLRHNLRVMQRCARGAEVWAVLKADGYGHGAKAVARTLERAGASGVCVALLEEGIELRQAGIRLPILVMGGFYGRAWGELLRHDLTPVVHDPSQVQALADEVRFGSSGPIAIHVKVDTGMARLGVATRDLEAMGASLKRHPHVQLDGLMTHFACADSGNTESLDHQLALFEGATQTLRQQGLTARVRHAANSAATLLRPSTHLDFVRPGIALFGVEPSPGMCPELRPVMRVRSEVLALHDLEPGMSVGYGATFRATRRTRVATIPMGYADGLSRGLSNLGHLLVRGGRAPIVGNVSMDMTMIDVTDLPDVRVGDECVVLGSQKGAHGEALLSAGTIASLLGTIPWEVLTSISRRVPRFYREP
ncbi:MAG TPA: alanine racemase [Polyangiaceae bacterium]|nr:alanine racemase [Polyangiaceae bacterium]